MKTENKYKQQIKEQERKETLKEEPKALAGFTYETEDGEVFDACLCYDVID